LKASISVGNSGLKPRVATWCLHPCPIPGRLASAAWLFSRIVSRLDAFSATRRWLSYSAVPCQTTDTPEATRGCSFRTYPLFPQPFTPLTDIDQTGSHRSEPS